MNRSRLKLTFASRILAGYLLVFGIASWVFYDALIEEIKPVVRQSAESALIDTANILAELVAGDVASRNLEHLSVVADRVKQRTLSAVVWEHLRTDVILDFYITDDQGIVLFATDKTEVAVGADYSRWRDVYLTLRGQYGARSSADNPYRAESTVMHIAAPVIYEGELIGVLTVYNPNNTMLPFIEASRKKVLVKWFFVLLASGVIATVLSLWLSRSVSRLANYAVDVQEGKQTNVPTLLGSELNQLAQALEQMRIKLEGKAYVEHYVQTLTHELKSPMAAIRGAAEMLEEDLPADVKEQFLGNIHEQNGRMQRTVDQMLTLASLENQTDIGMTQTLNATELLESVVNQAQAKADLKSIEIQIRTEEDFAVTANLELIKLALGNVLNNAIEFSLQGSEIGIQISTKQITVRDSGPGIPEYAQDKIGTRFFSLPRPDGQPKSTGLGLALTKEICRMHSITLDVSNRTDGQGAQVSFRF